MLKEEIIRTTESAEPKRYKYILNGETFYFTREELRKREVEKNKKNNLRITDVALEEELEQLIKKLEVYNGDPYGDYVDCPELYERFHKLESKGIAIPYFT
jgi:hypothetical protein